MSFEFLTVSYLLSLILFYITDGRVENIHISSTIAELKVNQVCINELPHLLTTRLKLSRKLTTKHVALYKSLLIVRYSEKCTVTGLKLVACLASRVIGTSIQHKL